MKKYTIILIIAIVSIACKTSDGYYNDEPTKPGKIAYNATRNYIESYIYLLNTAENVDLYRRAANSADKDSLALLYFYGYTITNPDLNTIMLSGYDVWTFKTNGRSLNADGAVWSISHKYKYDTRELIPEDGLIITKTAAEKWNLKIKNIILQDNRNNNSYYFSDDNLSSASMDITKLHIPATALSEERYDYLIAVDGKFHETSYRYEYNHLTSSQSANYIEIKYKSTDNNPLVCKFNQGQATFTNGIMDIEVQTNGRDKDLINVDLTASSENDIIIKMRFNTVTEIYRPTDRYSW